MSTWDHVYCFDSYITASTSMLGINVFTQHISARILVFVFQKKLDVCKQMQAIYIPLPSYPGSLANKFIVKQRGHLIALDLS